MEELLFGSGSAIACTWIVGANANIPSPKTIIWVLMDLTFPPRGSYGIDILMIGAFISGY